MCGGGRRGEIRTQVVMMFHSSGGALSGLGSIGLKAKVLGSLCLAVAPFSIITSCINTPKDTNVKRREVG